MSLDLYSVALSAGQPVAFVVIGFSLYKVYNRIVQTEAYAKRANHNTTAILKSLIRRGLLNDEDLKEIEFNG